MLVFTKIRCLQNLTPSSVRHASGQVQVQVSPIVTRYRLPVEPQITKTSFNESVEDSTTIKRFDGSVMELRRHRSNSFSVTATHGRDAKRCGERTHASTSRDRTSA
jgi:hypothetical protein